MGKGKCIYKNCENKEVLQDVWFCNKHLNRMYNLKIKKSTIKKSTIKNAGYGLFCGSLPIKNNQIVAEYSRYDIIKDCHNIKDSTYVYEDEGGICFDAKNTNNLIARFANDGRSDKKNNSFFLEFGGRIFIIASKNIKPGQEIFCEYGGDYWNDEV